MIPAILGDTWGAGGLVSESGSGGSGGGSGGDGYSGSCSFSGYVGSSFEGDYEGTAIFDISGDGYRVFTFNGVNAYRHSLTVPYDSTTTPGGVQAAIPGGAMAWDISGHNLYVYTENDENNDGYISRLYTGTPFSLSSVTPLNTYHIIHTSKSVFFLDFIGGYLYAGCHEIAGDNRTYLNKYSLGISNPIESVVIGDTQEWNDGYSEVFTCWQDNGFILTKLKSGSTGVPVILETYSTNSQYSISNLLKTSSSITPIVLGGAVTGFTYKNDNWYFSIPGGVYRVFLTPDCFEENTDGYFGPYDGYTYYISSIPGGYLQDISPDGYYLYTMGLGQYAQYALTTPFDITTMTLQNDDAIPCMDVSDAGVSACNPGGSGSGALFATVWEPSGHVLYAIYSDPYIAIRIFTSPVAYDISKLSFTGRQFPLWTSEGTKPDGRVFNADFIGNSLYICLEEQENKSVYIKRFIPSISSEPFETFYLYEWDGYFPAYVQYHFICWADPSTLMVAKQSADVSSPVIFDVYKTAVPYSITNLQLVSSTTTDYTGNHPDKFITGFTYMKNNFYFSSSVTSYQYVRVFLPNL